MSAQENAQVQRDTYTLPETLEILGGFLSDNGTHDLNLKRSDITFAGETETGATFVAHVTIAPESSQGYSSWNDFEYYNDVSKSIREKTVCPECPSADGSPVEALAE